LFVPRGKQSINTNYTPFVSLSFWKIWSHKTWVFGKSNTGQIISSKLVDFMWD